MINHKMFGINVSRKGDPVLPVQEKPAVVPEKTMKQEPVRAEVRTSYGYAELIAPAMPQHQAVRDLPDVQSDTFVREKGGV